MHFILHIFMMSAFCRDSCIFIVFKQIFISFSLDNPHEQVYIACIIMQKEVPP